MTLDTKTPLDQRSTLVEEPLLRLAAPLHSELSSIESYGRFTAGLDSAPTAAGEPRPLESVDLDVDRFLVRGEWAGRYLIEGEVGRGACGTVYRAFSPHRGHHVAIKVLAAFHCTDPKMVRRFEFEASAIAALDHENVVRLLDTGVLPDGRPFHAIELLSGTGLDTLIRARRRLALRDALPILLGVARALDAIHRAGFIHRDVKPSNIFLARENGAFVPKLIDFGIARPRASDREGPTEAGTLLGTPQYMAPEQCTGGEVRAPVDAYAFGVLAYELLVGSTPFNGDSALEVVLQHLHSFPRPPSCQVRTLPKDVDQLLSWLLHKSPEQRPERLEPIVYALAHATRDAATGC